MFEELYAQIEQYLIENKVDSINEIKSYCDSKLRQFFESVYPNYLNSFNDMGVLIGNCTDVLAKKYNIDKNEAYDRFTSDLDLILPNWSSYIDINNLANAISDVFIDRFYKNKYGNKEFGKQVDNFNDALSNTININVASGYKLETKKDLENLIIKIFNSYFDDNKLNAFTSKNGSRKYVLLKGKENILKEMEQEIKFVDDESALENERLIRESYINLYVKTSSLK